MINWALFHFVRPHWLWALLLVVAVIWVSIKRPVMNSVWRDAVDSHLLPYLLLGQQSKRRYVPVVLLVCALLITVIALAGPTWSRLPQSVYQADVTRMIVLDMSRSMDAADIKPSRLERAKFKALDLLAKIKEGQVGLVVFAAEPYVVSPLTEDSATIAAMIPTLETVLMPAQGSALDRALQKVNTLFTQTAISHGDVVIITDGLNGSSAIQAAAQLKSKGHMVSVIGVGTKEGAPIPQKSGGFVKNSAGGIVVPSLDIAELQSLASAGGGVFKLMSIDDSDLNDFLAISNVDGILQSESSTSQAADIWQDQGAWLVFLLLPLALLVFRREALVLVIAVMILPVAKPAYAFQWDELWLNENQRAEKIMQQGNYKQAYEQFTRPDWKGAASYRTGEYQQSIEQFSQGKTVSDTYNLGNALARTGKLEEAIKAYDHVLQTDVDHEDAKANKSLVESLLEQQQEQQQQQDQSGEKDKNSEQQSGNGEDSETNQQASSGQSEEDEKDGSGQEDSDKSGENKQLDNQDKAAGDEKDQQKQAQKNDAASEEAKMSSKENNEADDKSREKIQATQQWLSRIKDDPGGLLRQKFIREHQRRRAQGITQDASAGDQW